MIDPHDCQEGCICKRMSNHSLTEGVTRGGNGAIKNNSDCTAPNKPPPAPKKKGCMCSGCCSQTDNDAEPQYYIGVKEPHYHKDEQGKLVKCYHECKNLFQSYAFWIGITISYPLEHFAWGLIYSWMGWSH